MEGTALMRARTGLTVALLAAAARIASAQNATADGVAALARGDYQRAAAILKPIAESNRVSDVAAQFFMAMMYENGQGVPVDAMRACALYSRAGNSPGNPFSEQTMPLFRALMRSHDQAWIQDCQLLATVGFDHGFEPVTFTLGPRHSTAWDLKGATVTYGDRSRRFPMGLASRGTVFLPLQHTELATGPTRSIVRHFIEVFLWRPSPGFTSWALEWHAFEIARDELIRVSGGSEELTRIAADAPPSATTFDVRAYATLRVADNGEAEWAILQGRHQQTQLIPSEAERREVHDQTVAREAANKRVDWAREFDEHRPPSLAYADADGCGAIQVYGWSDDHAEVIGVYADQNMIPLSTRPSAIDIARQTAGLRIEIHVYARARRGFPFCTDVGTPAIQGPFGLDETWRAVAGTLTIQLSPPGVRAQSPQQRRAMVTLTDAVFVNQAGVRVRQTRPIALTAIVGGAWGG